MWPSFLDKASTLFKKKKNLINQQSTRRKIFRLSLTHRSYIQMNIKKQEVTTISPQRGGGDQDRQLSDKSPH